MKMKSPMKKSKDKDRDRDRGDRHHKSSKDHRDGKRKREHRWVKNRFIWHANPNPDSYIVIWESALGLACL